MLKAKIFAALIAAIVLPGCAWPHRSAVTTRTVEWFDGREDGLIARETLRDSDGGGGVFLFADPQVASLCVWHTNQIGLGGGSRCMTGPFSITVDSNLVPAITATGTAAGNIIGAAVKTAVK
jgi:hypothetical protein